MSFSIRALLGLALATLLASPGLAATAEQLVAAEGPEIVRDASDLVDVVRPDIEDKDVTDTVLLFTNKTSAAKRVKCIAFNKNGRAIGRAWLSVPGFGLRYAFASDVAHDLDFVGHVQCYVGADVIGSSLLLAGGQVTDLPVDNGAMTSQGRRILFPVAATY
jgi:hypothetical protein